MGKHYGKEGERIGDPLENDSHTATIRQLMRFYLLLEQGRLVNAEASQMMRKIFLSPEIPPDKLNFWSGLWGRDVTMLRKWGQWQDWYHDSAIINGPRRHYILACLTMDPNGDKYLAELAVAADDLLKGN